MFCPSCGRNNIAETKFCSSCGTNLEVVSQALSGSTENLFTRIDASFDQFLARYSEHVFKNAPVEANERSPKGSWKVLGESAVTSFVDVILFALMWNILPFRFLMLLIATPIKMLSKRSNRKNQSTEREVRQPKEIPANSIQEKWLVSPAISVSEHTTESLTEYREAGKREQQSRE